MANATETPAAEDWDWVVTVSGRRIHLIRPDPAQYDIEDIAMHLSNLPRWCAASQYSVAQHSWLASFMVDAPHARQALMHDSPEFVLGDLSAPAKRLCGGYRALEETQWSGICTAFNIHPVMDPQVKRADLVLRATERRDLFNHAGLYPLKPDEAAVVPMAFTIKPWPAELARARFLERFRALENARNA